MITVAGFTENHIIHALGELWKTAWEHVHRAKKGVNIGSYGLPGVYV